MPCTVGTIFPFFFPQRFPHFMQQGSSTYGNFPLHEKQIPRSPDFSAPLRIFPQNGQTGGYKRSNIFFVFLPPASFSCTVFRIHRSAPQDWCNDFVHFYSGSSPEIPAHCLRSSDIFSPSSLRYTTDSDYTKVWDPAKVG